MVEALKIPERDKRGSTRSNGKLHDLYQGIVKRFGEIGIEPKDIFIVLGFKVKV